MPQKQIPEERFLNMVDQLSAKEDLLSGTNDN